MRKTVAFLFALTLLLSGCGEKKTETVDHSQTISALEESWAGETAEYRSLQKDLARWYNVNLTSENPEADYEAAYDRILYYEGGVMGYAEIPSLGLAVPVFHGNVEGGFSHDPSSAFAVGSRGNHTVLRWDGEINLAEGERVILWMLGEPLVYVFGQEGEATCTLICPNGSWKCGHVVED